LCRTLYQDSFDQNIAVRSLLGPRRLQLKKDAVLTILNFTSQRLDKKKTKKKRRNKLYADTEDWYVF